MTNWNKSEPSGLELVAQGANRVREAKAALLAALGVEHYFTGADLNMVHKMPFGNAVDGYAGRWRYNDSSGQIEAYLSGAWTPITKTASIVSGDTMLFYQAAAPAGWTQNTVYGNDAFLRVAGSGAIGSGGSWAPQTDSFSTPHQHSVSTVTIALYHVQTQGKYAVTGVNVDGIYNVSTHGNNVHTHPISNDTDSPHYHTIDSAWRPEYVDVIACSKN